MKIPHIAFLSTLTVATLGLISGCGNGDQEHGAAKEPAVRVPVEIVASAPIRETYEAVGTVQSRTVSVLSTRIMGNVQSVHAAPGDVVQRGQLLLQISDADIQAQVRKAAAGLVEAESAWQEAEWAVKAAESAMAAADAAKSLAVINHDRLRALLRNKSASQSEFDEAEAGYKTALAEAERADQMRQAAQARRQQALAKMEQARAEIASAEAQVPYTSIAAPMDGVVTAKNVDAGSFVAPGTPLLQVEDNRNYRVEAAVEESQLRHVRIGDEAQVRIDAIGGDAMKGRISEIVPTSDPRSRTLLVRVDLPRVKPEGQGGAITDSAQRSRMYSGMFARVSFAAGERQARTVPLSAVGERGQLLVTYVLDAQDRAHLRLVKTGRSYDGRVEILSGLNDGERVVADKVGLVREGARVEAENPAL